MDHWIPNRDPRPTFHPLRGLIDPMPATVAEAYLAAYTAPGDLVLDPFAIDPTVARVARKMERRAIALETHPLWSWILRALALPPTPPEIDAVLTRWGDTLKDDVPLRAHVDQLYATICAACQRTTPADYFIRARAGEVLARHYTCAHCGVTRDDPATDDDFQRATAFDARGFHYHFAYERVVPDDNLWGERIRKILALYTPRNLYALVTLTLKADALFREPRERAIVSMLTLYLLNRGSSLYPAPNASAQLGAHAEVVEFNLWRANEAAARAWRESDPPLELSDNAKDVYAVDLPRVLVRRGSARALARELEVTSRALTKEFSADKVALVLAQPPVSRAPLWALAYFFGAWALGRAAMRELVPYLDPGKDAAWERGWYAELLAETLNATEPLLRPDARIVFAFHESRHVVSDALLLAACGTRWELESLLFQPRIGDFPHHEFADTAGEYRLTFVHHDHPPYPRLSESEFAARVRTAALAGARGILVRRGEPLAYTWVHHAAYAHAAREGWLEQAARAKLPVPPYRFIADAVRAGLREGYAQDLDHYQSADQFLWDCAGKNAPPLIERVEDAVREILEKRQTLGRVELEDEIYRRFAGDLTPEAGAVELLARAYADERDGAWHWRGGDAPAQKARALEWLTRLGERLQFEIAREIAPFDLAWREGGEIAYGFVWRARLADLARVHLLPTRGYLIVTNDQLPITLEKTRRQPHLADAFHDAGWDFLRVELVEPIAGAERIAREDFLARVGLTPAKARQLDLL